MAKLPILSSREIVRILKRMGFEHAPKRGKGSHLAFVRKSGGVTRLVIVPDKNEIPSGTLLSILSQAGLTKEEFLNALEHR